MSTVAVVSNSSQKVTGLEQNCLEKRTQADFKDLWSFSAKKNSVSGTEYINCMANPSGVTHSSTIRTLPTSKKSIFKKTAAKEPEENRRRMREPVGNVRSTETKSQKTIIGCLNEPTIYVKSYYDLYQTVKHTSCSRVKKRRFHQLGVVWFIF
ncbi:hypothetical protein RUM43_002585 [Polyplax serrata]|uniref:Uncharacterized protein n=1 Tax=Polyplax serrata TaxID=468196 RepID=A0AAN8NTP5_POLSC